MKHLITLLFLLIVVDANAQFEFSNSIYIKSAKPIDARLAQSNGSPYTSAAQANNAANNPIAYRYPNMTINVDSGGVEKTYWYRGGVANSNLVLKTSSAGATSAGATGGIQVADGAGGFSASGWTANGSQLIYNFYNPSSGPAYIQINGSGTLSAQNAPIALESTQYVIASSPGGLIVQGPLNTNSSIKSTNMAGVGIRMATVLADGTFGTAPIPSGGASADTLFFNGTIAPSDTASYTYANNSLALWGRVKSYVAANSGGGSGGTITTASGLLKSDGLGNAVASGWTATPDYFNPTGGMANGDYYLFATQLTKSGSSIRIRPENVNSLVLQGQNGVGSVILGETGQGDAQINAATLYITSGSVYATGLPVYADDAAAATGGLSAGRLYKTSAGALMVKN